MIRIYMKKTADLLLDSRGPEIQHRSGLTAPDPFIYLFPEGEKPMVFFEGKEYGVQQEKLKTLHNGVQIEHIEPYTEKITDTSLPPLIATLIYILNQFAIDTVRVSPSLSYSVGHALEKAGKKVIIYNYEAEREHKTEQEIQHLIAAQRVNESAFELAWNILRSSTIDGNTVVYEGQILTSEYMKALLRKHLLDKGYECPEGIVVASGEASARPHDMGSGPILPHTCIVVDIFPRSEKTGFFADMTRTFVKGNPSPEIQALYRAVEKVQKNAAERIAVGDSCREVHAQTVKEFADAGHQTSHEQGFMHGTGHSLGLSIHEEPRFNARSSRTIEPGMVFTVEPGLYYPAIGGVRIEDVVVFHPDGRKENITHFNKPYIIP